ncbi:MAG TPA: cytochrome c [Gemmatimonadaceae bacterium]|nr:cytochrome c [Gemmatimonadaceae bacterium]
MSADVTRVSRVGVILSEARDLLRFARRNGSRALLIVSLGGCSWFTDFKQQPKIDPWDTPNDSTPPRGNPQGSVPLYGSSAPDFMYGRDFAGLNAMSALANPVPVSQESVDRGRKAYQVNCSVCHGPAGMGLQTSPMFKFGIFAPSLAAPASPSATTLTDGYIFGIIRNGRGLMPAYNRIEDQTRWDVVNYIRTLQGRTGLAADTTHGRPGETGPQFVIGATISAPTRPAPYYAPIGAQAGAREGLTGTSATANPRAGAPAPTTTVPPGTTPDTTRPPAHTPPAANKPPTPEAPK